MVKCRQTPNQKVGIGRQYLTSSAELALLLVGAEAKGSELNGSCPLNGSVVLVVCGAPELDGMGLAPEVAVVLLNGSLLKKSPTPPPPAPVLAPPEPEVWGEKWEIAIMHCTIKLRV